jgi:hypothetical protein
MLQVSHQGAVLLRSYAIDEVREVKLEMRGFVGLVKRLAKGLATNPMNPVNPVRGIAAILAALALVSLAGCTTGDPSDGQSPMPSAASTASTSGSRDIDVRPTLPATSGVSESAPVPPSGRVLPDDIRAAFVGEWVLVGMESRTGTTAPETMDAGQLAAKGISGTLRLDETFVAVLTLASGPAETDSISEPGIWDYTTPTQITVTVSGEPSQCLLRSDGTLQFILTAESPGSAEQSLIWARY